MAKFIMIKIENVWSKFSNIKSIFPSYHRTDSSLDLNPRLSKVFKTIKGPRGMLFHCNLIRVWSKENIMGSTCNIIIFNLYAHHQDAVAPSGTYLVVSTWMCPCQLFRFCFYILKLFFKKIKFFKFKLIYIFLVFSNHIMLILKIFF
jgi:hypothetical protein